MILNLLKKLQKGKDVKEIKTANDLLEYLDSEVMPQLSIDEFALIYTYITNNDSEKLLEDITLGQFVDLCYMLKAEQSRRKRELDMVETIRKEFYRRIIDLCQKNDLSGAPGKIAKIKVGDKMFISVADKELFYIWAVKENRFDLLNKVVNKRAAEEMIEQENLAPEGCEFFTKVDVTSLTKI